MERLKEYWKNLVDFFAGLWKRVNGFRGISRWIFRLVTTIFILFLLVFLSLQLRPVRNWIIARIDKALEEKLQTKVNIQDFRFTLFDKIRLEGFVLEGFHQDTVIQAELLSANIGLNPITIIRKGIVIEALRLVNASVKVTRFRGEEDNNLNILLNRLFSNKSEDKKNGNFQMDLGQIEFEQVLYSNYDVYKGNHLSIFVNQCIVAFRETDFPGKILRVRAMELTEPIIKVTDFNREAEMDSLQAENPVDSNLVIIKEKAFEVEIEQFIMNRGRFSAHNLRKAPVKLTPPDELDYKHLEVFDINMSFKNFNFDDNLNFQGEIRQLAFRDSTGFVLNNISSDFAKVTPKGILLHGLKLETPNSVIGDTLEFFYDNYTAFYDFNNEVEMDSRLSNTKLALKDLMVFAPGLKNVRFFNENQNQSIRVDGRIRGLINQLEGKDLDIRLSDGSRFLGEFNSYNLAVKDEEFMDFTINQLNASVNTFRRIIPGLDLPPSFDRLDNLNFQGSFLGFFHDFVAYGYLKSDIGDAKMDLNLNLIGGREKATYSGSLALIDFDLGKWTLNDDFGKVNIITKIDDGKGLTGEAADATLSANVSSFFFRDYKYENAEFKGKLNKNLLDGDFLIQDGNIDFLFKGKLNFLYPVNTYAFNAVINRLDLKKLNLSNKDWLFSGRLDLNIDRNLSNNNVTGNIHLTEFNLLADQEKQISIKNIYGESIIDTITNNNRVFVNSDVLDGSINGNFRLDQLANVFLNFIKKYHPETARRLEIKEKPVASTPFFDWDFKIKQSLGLDYIIHPSLGPFENIQFKGSFDGEQDSLKASLVIPDLKFGNVGFQEIAFFVDAVKEEGDFDFSVEKTVFNEKQELDPVRFLSTFFSDTALFTLNYASSEENVLDQLNLSGRVFPYDTVKYEVKLDQSDLTILKNNWTIDQDNYLRISKDSIEVTDFRLTNEVEDRYIRLESFGRSGLNLFFSNADFHKIDEYWDYEPLDFFGKYNLSLRISDVFKMQNLNMIAWSDTLVVNNDDWGAFRLDVHASDLKSQLTGYLSITKDTSQLLAEGTFNLVDQVEKPKSDAQKSKYFDFLTNIHGFPLNISEYFIGNSVKDVTGTFNANLHFFGFGSKPNIEGELQVSKGALTVDYLKTRYSFEPHLVNVDNFIFDASNLVMRDKFGNEAVLLGGIRHNHLKDLGFDALLETKRFLALDTKKGDNNLFYGRALGGGRIRFTGSFEQPNVTVDAAVGKSTKLVIPLDAGRESSDSKYIKILAKPKSKVTKSEREITLPPLLKGVSLEMDLEVNDEAQVEIIFDEQTGDIIRGSGRGNLRILVPRTGDFEMYGDYIIEKGDYLFTLYNLVNKKFIVQPGGTIRWNGSPFGADIDLEANYSDISASVANLIQEYLVNAREDLQTTASLPTEVNLKMRLEGELLRPIINFGIEMPQLKGLLETYTNNKLRLLERDQNELYKQVFGLIAMGQFIPSEFDFRGAGNEIIYNTLSEFVSNQLSLLITELFSEFIEDGSVLSGIDFDINYNPSQQVKLQGQNINAGDELEVRLRQDFFNDRLSVIVGGNIDLSGNLSAAPRSSGTFVGNDLVIEYLITPERNLKLRVYQRLLPDIGGGSRLQLGTGLSFRKEFDSFSEFLKSFRKNAKKDKN